MKALFVCDDKEEWDFLTKFFGAHFPKIGLICAIKGADAMEYLSYEGPFAFILIDCGIKGDEPTDLAEKIYEQSGERPIVFIGNEVMLKNRISDDFYMSNETAIAYKKPYDIAEFKKIIIKALEWAKREEYESSIVEVDRDNYLPMKIRNFYLFESVPYDVYIELTKTKFVKALSKNKPYTQSKIQEFARRNLKFLYLEKTAHIRFLEESIIKTSNLLRRKGLPPKKVIQAQIAAALIIQQYLRDVGISESVINLTELIIITTDNNFNYFSSFKEILQQFPMEHADYAEQAILLSYTCEALSRGMGWNSDLSRKKLGLAALIHDCMLTEESMVQISRLNTPQFEKMPEILKDEFVNHPKNAAELSKHFSGFTDVEFIIEEHHELPDGTGFPHGKNSNKLTSISCVFILASNFVTSLSVNGLTKLSINTTLNAFANDYNVGNFKDPYKVLKRLLKGL